MRSLHFEQNGDRVLAASREQSAAAALPSSVRSHERVGYDGQYGQEHEELT
jgi:hypothetical protein